MHTCPHKYKYVHTHQHTQTDTHTKQTQKHTEGDRMTHAHTAVVAWLPSEEAFRLVVNLGVRTEKNGSGGGLIVPKPCAAQLGEECNTVTPR